jgi:sortase A
VLTTCHPKFSAKQRLIVFGDLVSTKPVASPAAA